MSNRIEKMQGLLDRQAQDKALSKQKTRDELSARFVEKETLVSKVADGLHIVDQLHDIRDSLWEYGEIEVDNEPNQTTYFTLVARWPRYKAGWSKGGNSESYWSGGPDGDWGTRWIPLVVHPAITEDEVKSFEISATVTTRRDLFRKVDQLYGYGNRLHFLSAISERNREYITLAETFLRKGEVARTPTQSSTSIKRTDWDEKIVRVHVSGKKGRIVWIDPNQPIEQQDLDQFDDLVSEACIERGLTRAYKAEQEEDREIIIQEVLSGNLDRSAVPANFGYTFPPEQPKPVIQEVPKPVVSPPVEIPKKRKK